MGIGLRRVLKSGLQKQPTKGQFPHEDILADIQREWDKTEEAIKRSEQIALDVSIPAISELRYAGRRIVDALNEARTGNSLEKVQAYLEDARFCCYRARHDAMDAAFAKIAIDLDNLTNRLGYDAVISAFPDFSAFYTDFKNARNAIAASRGNRNNRNGIYNTIITVDFPDLAKRYADLMTCEPIAKAFSAKRRAERIGWWFMLAITVGSLLVAIIQTVKG